jgi:hypothetical protein
MYIDKNLNLATAASAIVNNGSQLATTNVLDSGVLRNIGVGTTLYVRIQFTTSITQGSGGFNIAAVYSSATALNADVIETSRLSLVAADATAGKIYYLPIAPSTVAATKRWDTAPVEKYFGLVLTPFTANITAGAWTVDIVDSIGDFTDHYAHRLDAEIN